MPGVDDIKASWADEVELDAGGLPPTTEVIENGQKFVTEYKYVDEKKTKVVRTYKITTQNVPKSVARRKNLPKFGDSAKDKAGPNSHTTLVSEDVFLQFLSAKEEEKTNESHPENMKNFAKCCICSGEHWSVNCPYKGTAMDTGKLMENKPTTSSTEPSKPGKYIPPFLKDSGKAGAPGLRGRDDTAAIRISNLSESMTETDLEELVKTIGPHSKMYLARDKNTGMCKGFAYVHFKLKNDAANAIAVLNGHGYDHLILNVEWSKPQTN